MYYYEIMIASQLYHKSEQLTYSSEIQLATGTVVAINLKDRPVVGIVTQATKKPNFTTKPIQRTLTSTGVPREVIRLTEWLQDYYPAPSGSITQLIAPSYLLRSSTAKQPAENDYLSIQATSLQAPELTEEQSSALSQLAGDNRPALLHGDTGSGKTRIYIEMAIKSIQYNRSVIVITPEISLTPQLIRVFTEHLQAPILTMHSSQTNTERQRIWNAALRSETPIVLIGPRSSLFAPVKNVGLIIVDEFHDDALKQEQLPRYSTTRVAGYLAKLHGAKLILGSATPPVTDYFAFEGKHLPIIRMAKPAIPDQHETKLDIVDLKDKALFTKSRWISDPLLDALQVTLESRRQSLLFLNRRGTARLTLCQSCGWQALCPNCDLPVTYHHDQYKIRCHTCGYSSKPIVICPVCNSADIIFRSIGTKTIVSEIERLFPEARTTRFDSDTPKAERIEKLYEELRTGKVDIIIGTQMVTKGLDLPMLGTVGVIIGDTSLYFPDYTAEEKTFQMISQVIGRVGRGHGSSKIVIQTYSPESFSITTAVHKDYKAFYTSQLTERSDFSFPPFCFTLKLRVERKSSNSADKALKKIVHDTKSKFPGINISNPSPCFNEKTKNGYSWQAVVKASRRSTLLSIVSTLPSGIYYDLDPLTLL